MKFHELFADFIQSILTPNLCSLPPCNKVLQYFDAKKVPELGIKEYVERFAAYLKIDESTYVSAYVLIKRLLKLNPGTLVTPLNVHRLLVTAITITDKIQNDFYWRNTDYAIVGVEIEFIKGLDYDLRIGREEYESIWREISETDSAKNDRCVPCTLRCYLSLIHICRCRRAI
eukprot:TRINITY_DN4130_c0_g1_i19.p1 TRINITY_DN4130_c0_g1~~TRINITY_DN4130_c0_g1_i19.p1  ORF type:complete len:173 (-),score=26.35 TRINITY_DN4130_c0_g1_i19:50-568(-)